MRVTDRAIFNRTESIGLLQCGGGRKKAPTRGAFCLSINLGRQLFPYRGGAVADLVNHPLKFFPGYFKMLGPILHLPGFMHVDLRAILLALVFQALHFVLLMKSKPANQNQALVVSEALPRMEKQDLANFVPARRFCTRPIIAWRSSPRPGRRDGISMARDACDG
jgi:hypothetical protein